MKTFIQLKDNVGFATINTLGETDGIEVPFGTGDDYLGQAYDNGSWSAAPTIKYAVVDENGNILEIRQTKFSSERGSFPEWNTEIPLTWKWKDNSWTEPELPAEIVVSTPEPDTSESSSDPVDPISE